MKKRYYYRDEKNDDFAGILRNSKEIPANYCYLHYSVWWKILSFIAYRVVMTPIAFLYCKFKFGLSIRNKDVIPKKGGFFLYGNHTQIAADGFFPTMVSYPIKPYVIVNPDSVALKGTESFMLMIGAMPVPTELKGLGTLMKAIATRIQEGNSISIYPEKHIWPYYTGIRPFEEVSFRYPVSLNKPSFSVTTTYQKRKWSRKPAVTLYIDGPFYPDLTISAALARRKLRNDIYEAMNSHSLMNSCEYIEYVRYEKLEKFVKSNDERLHLLYCGNEKVVQGISLSVISVLLHTRTPIDVTVLTMKISDGKAEERAITECHIAGLRKWMLQRDEKNSIQLIDLTELFGKSLKNSVNLENFYTPYCLLRLFADLIPELTEKVLYLDADTIILKDLTPVYHLETEHYELAASVDYLGRVFKHPGYFNSGILLMNLKKMRETGLLQKSREYVLHKKKAFPDQEALNSLAKYVMKMPRDDNEQRRIRKHTVIRHCCKSLRLFPYIHTVNRKPWQREVWEHQPEKEYLDEIYRIYDRECVDMATRKDAVYG